MDSSTAHQKSFSAIVNNQNPIPPTPQMVLNAVFEDMNNYGAAAGGWDLDFRQLDMGRMRARATIIAGPRVAALGVGFDRRLHQQGCCPEGVVVFGLPDQPLWWCGVQANPGDVLNFNLTSGFEGISEAGFSGTVLLLDRDEMRRRAADLGIELRPDQSIGSASSWGSPGHQVSHLRRRLDMMFRSFGSLAGQVDASELLNESIQTTLLRVLVADLQAPRPTDASVRRKALQTALEILEEPARFPLRVADLCDATNVSPPTLYRAFQEHFGVSPKRYLQARSLAGVRRELLSASPTSRIINIANRWGFWHMGQFAADYRRQFGELPSETLARR